MFHWNCKNNPWKFLSRRLYVFEVSGTVCLIRKRGKANNRNTNWNRAFTMARTKPHKWRNENERSFSPNQCRVPPLSCGICWTNCLFWKISSATGNRTRIYGLGNRYSIHWTITPDGDAKIAFFRLPAKESSFGLYKHFPFWIVYHAKKLFSLSNVDRSQTCLDYVVSNKSELFR